MKMASKFIKFPASGQFDRKRNFGLAYPICLVYQAVIRKKTVNNGPPAQERQEQRAQTNAAIIYNPIPNAVGTDLGSREHRVAGPPRKDATSNV